MRMLLNEFKNNLTEYLVHFLWRQWAQLGVAAASVEHEDDWVIDPEALWLLSGTFARHDARLFDEIMDWLARNAAFINIPRLRSLSRKFRFSGMVAVSAMAEVVKETNSRLHWRFPPLHGDNELEPLFFYRTGEPMPDFGLRDPVFERYGFTRGRLELRGMSRRFNPVMPTCSLLRLRALLGTSARAEIILYLLTHDMAHPSLVARETGYSQKNVQDTLVDMCASGLVHPAQLEGRKKLYFMKHEHRSPFLHMPERPPQWMTWPPLFRGLEMLVEGVAALDTRDISAMLREAELRRLMSDVQSYFEAAGCAGLVTTSRIPMGKEALESLFNDLREVLG